MMLSLLLMLLAGGDPKSQAPAPATALVVDLVERAGAVHRVLTVRADATVAPSERAAVEEALLGTGMFELAAAEAPATLHLSRPDAARLRGVLLDPDGRERWAHEIAWPSHDEGRATPHPRDERLATYRERSLRVRARPADPLDPTPKAPLFESDWQILRGGAEVLDDVTFAQIIGDPALELRLREERDATRLAYRLGLGAAALAGVGAGIALHQGRGADRETLGTSLIVVGGACAILALVVPELMRGYRLSPDEAQHRAELYNRSLRTELGLAPTDVEER